MRIQHHRNPQRLFAGAIVAGLLVGGCLLPPTALGNDQYPTGTGQYSPGQVVECQNANGSTYACALSDTGPFAVTVTKPGIAPSGNDRAQVVTISPNSGAPGQYPTGASPITVRPAPWLVRSRPSSPRKLGFAVSMFSRPDRVRSGRSRSPAWSAARWCFRVALLAPWQASRSRRASPPRPPIRRSRSPRLQMLRRARLT
jgi:hypothetical protein